MTQQPTIALLIPTFNASKNWMSVLKSINEQTYQNIKKIIIDSGSTDNTVDLAKQFGFEIITVPKSEFNHGATRQLLVDISEDTDICVFLTQDAILASPDSIGNIIKVFDDQQVGIAYGRQLPHKNAKSLETHARLFNYPDNSEVLSMDDLDKKGFKIFFCSNSFSAYRRSALLAVGGFPTDSIMGEDAIVAAKMLVTGYKKAYVADAMVHHSHSYTLGEEFRRYFDTRVFHEQNKWLINDFGKPTGEGLKFIKSELNYVIKHDKTSFFKSISSVFAKWLGYNSGRFFRKMPKSLVKKLSMHSFYWK
ncbi:glycosyltransferase [Mucilaginibacter sp. X5P1]|uniref:glycosyltransferase n=1 Tax=Mucilaginibacter sp. X5P1 TaxID=2723088 RepID=UPI0016117125|nr:glycosyltransferase family 2 protein [Mucilaginibacter sp. X5P1]MBB6138206.1 rhamnosyltransferase [Mucilaginibacter sp. X5P1]